VLIHLVAGWKPLDGSAHLLDAPEARVGPVAFPRSNSRCGRQLDLYEHLEELGTFAYNRIIPLPMTMRFDYIWESI
jgi:hypothetical protein